MKLKSDSQCLMELKYLKVLEILKRSKGLLNGKLLDAGTGGGCNLIRQLRSIGEEGLVIGIDCNSEFIHTCKQVLKDPMTGWMVHLLLGNIIKLPFKEETFDIVTALDVLEHQENPAVALREIHRVLRPGGVLISTTPNWPDKMLIPIRKRRKKADYTIYGFAHLSAHCSYGWSRLICNNGFKIQRIRTVKFPLIHSEFLANKLHILGMCVLIESIKIKN